MRFQQREAILNWAAGGGEEAGRRNKMNYWNCFTFFPACFPLLLFFFLAKEEKPGQDALRAKSSVIIIIPHFYQS